MLAAVEFLTGIGVSRMFGDASPKKMGFTATLKTDALWIPALQGCRAVWGGENEENYQEGKQRDIKGGVTAFECRP